MQSNYYSLDDILSEEDNVHVITLIEGKDLGWMLSDQVIDDLPVDSNLELPLWLAKSLKLHNMVKVDISKHYYDHVMISAPTVVNLKKISPYFYFAGYKVARLINCKYLLKIIKNVFTARFKQLINYSLYFVNKDILRFTKDLPYLEKRLILFGNKSAIDYNDFKTRQHIKVKCSNVMS